MTKNVLNKRGFIEHLREKGYTIKDASIAIDDIFDTITEVLANGDAVTFHGFGTFSPIELKERRSTKVRTQEEYIVPAHKAAKFTPGAALKRAVREGIAR